MNLQDLRSPPQGVVALSQYAWELYDSLRATRDIRSPGVRIRQTTRGVSRTVIVTDQSGGGKAAALQFKGQWADGSYDEDDIVIREQNAELDLALGSTYIANADVVAGDLPPGESAGSGAVLTVHITAGVITSIDIAGGTGYPGNAFVQITGDGAGAIAHVTFSSYGVPDTVIVDNGGSAYTTATAILTNGDQHWEDFALFRTKKWTLLRDNQRITINVGRDDTDNLELIIEKDKTDGTGTAGRIRISMADLLAITGSHVVAFHELETCEGDAPMHRIFLCSEAY